MALDSTQLASLLTANSIGEDQAAEIRQLMEDFAFSPVIQALAAKFSINPIDSAATLSADRSQLKQFVASKFEETSIEVLEIERQALRIEENSSQMPDIVQEKVVVIAEPENLSSFAKYLRQKNGKPQYIDYENFPRRFAAAAMSERASEENLRPAAVVTRDRKISKKRSKHLRKDQILGKIVDQSLVSSEEAISETLATLLANQGHLEKAREMYRKLSLANPEKSAIFAEQIEKLKKK